MMTPLAVLFLTVTLVQCYPNFVPQSVCLCMIPSHAGITAQSSDPPYKIVTGRYPNSSSDVEVRILPDPEIKIFEGFYIQARDEQDNIVGRFYNDQLHGMTQDCERSLQNAVHHTSNAKKKFIQLRWSPDAIEENVHFRATVVRSFKTYWTNVTSEQITPGSISTILPDLDGAEPVDGHRSIESFQSAEITDRMHYGKHHSSEEDNSSSEEEE